MRSCYTATLRFQIVRFFAVLSNVQAFHFVLFRDAETGNQVGYFENHDRAEQSETPGEEYSDQLISHLAPIPVARAHRLAVAKNWIDDGLCEHSRQQRAYRSARAVHAKSVQRVIIPEERLHLR